MRFFTRGSNGPSHERPLSLQPTPRSDTPIPGSTDSVCRPQPRILRNATHHVTLIQTRSAFLERVSSLITASRGQPCEVRAATFPTVLPLWVPLPAPCHALRCALGLPPLRLLRAVLAPPFPHGLPHVFQVGLGRMPLSNNSVNRTNHKHTTNICNPRGGHWPVPALGNLGSFPVAPLGGASGRCVGQPSHPFFARGVMPLVHHPRPNDRSSCRIYPRTGWSEHLLSPTNARARLEERTERRCGSSASCLRNPSA